MCIKRPIVFILTGLLIIPSLAVAQEACPAGTVPVTDRALARAAGVPDSSQCWQPQNKAIGQDVAAAKQYLGTQLTGAAAGRGAVSANNMVPIFACRLASLMKAAPPGVDIKIFSGWRDSAAQARALSTARPGYACASGAACPHPQGRAADLTFNGRTVQSAAECSTNFACKWAHQNAPQYGLTFPLMGGSVIEPWHIEPRERAGVNKSAACDGSSVTPFSPTGTAGTPGATPTGGSTGTGTLTPTSYASNPFANPYSPMSPTGALGAGLMSGLMAPPPPPPPPAPMPTTPAQTTTGITPSYVTPTVQNPIITDPGTTPAATPTTSPVAYVPYTTAATSSSASTNVQTGTRGTSAIDEIIAIAEGTTTRSTQLPRPATTGPALLNPELYDIQPSTTQSAVNVGTIVYAENGEVVLASTSIAIQPIHVTETFSGQQPLYATSTWVPEQNRVNTALVVVLDAVRNLVNSFRNAMIVRDSYGFNGAWHPVSSGDGDGH